MCLTNSNFFAMKKFLLLSCAVLFALSGCKKEGANTEITNLEFKKGSYELYENDSDMNMKKELVAAPDGILDKEKIVWKVSDEEVAEMSGNFIVPIIPGDVKVTATVQNISATCNVSILPVPVESITLEDMTVALYGSSQIKCTTVPSGISLKRITFSSSDDDIAYVNSDGMVQGKGTGDATITATVDDKTATCKVTVKKIDVTSVVVAPKSYRFSEAGEMLQLTATINPSDASVKIVTWSSSNTDVATVDENGLVTCVSAGDAIITAAAEGKSDKCTISVTAYGTVKDCQGNEYKTVKLGTQWWMAENMRATKYSPNNTDSKNISIAIISSGAESKYTPYCINASNKENWYETDHWDTDADALVSKLGYLYNWAAAVGVAEGDKVKSSFSGNRQGICPDGWHIPSASEWHQLDEFITESEGGMAGKHLKTTTGWDKKSENYKPALDSYNFSILPAGTYYDWWHSEGGYYSYILNSVGTHGVFWTVSLDSYSPEPYAIAIYFTYMSDEMNFDNTYHLWSYKKDGLSVRCVKN